MSWRNWGDHPLIVTIGALGGIAGVIALGYTIFSPTAVQQPIQNSAPQNNSKNENTVNGNNNNIVNNTTINQRELDNIRPITTPSTAHIVVHQSGTQASQMLQAHDNFIITQAMADAPKGSQQKDIENATKMSPVEKQPSFLEAACDNSPFRILNASDKTQVVRIGKWETDNIITIGIGPGERWEGLLSEAVYVISDEAEHWGDAFEIAHCK